MRIKKYDDVYVVIDNDIIHINRAVFAVRLLKSVVRHYGIRRFLVYDVFNNIVKPDELERKIRRRELTLLSIKKYETYSSLKQEV